MNTWLYLLLGLGVFLLLIAITSAIEFLERYR